MLIKTKKSAQMLVELLATNLNFIQTSQTHGDLQSLEPTAFLCSFPKISFCFTLESKAHDNHQDDTQTIPFSSSVVLPQQILDSGYQMHEA